MAAGRGVEASVGSGTIALAHSERTLPSVSAPSRVVRSIIEIAVSMAQAFAVVLIERVPRPAARPSAPTWSTPGRPCSQVVSAALVRRETPRRSRARPVASTVSRGAMEVLTEEVYGVAECGQTMHGVPDGGQPRAGPLARGSQRRAVRHRLDHL